MSSIQNPRVEVVPCDNGLAGGFKGGRPLDGVVVIDSLKALERPGSPVSGVGQPLPKRGRNLEKAMVVNDEPRQVVAEVLGLDGSGSQVMGAADGLNKSSVPSFKDMLVGDKDGLNTSRTLSELDVDVREDDVRVGRSSTLPEIQFSDQVHSQVDAQLARSVIVRLLGKSIGYRALLNRIRSLWSPKGDMSLIDLDNEYYLARFALEEDFQMVLSGGPWVIYGNYLTVQPWSRGFSTSEAHPSHIMVWVRLPKLPYRYYTKSMFRHIANAIGKVVRVDYNTSEGKRGRIGHSKELCEGEKADMSLKVAQGVQRDPTEPYGAWMQVVNHRRRAGAVAQLQNRGTRVGSSMAPGGSRFTALEEEGEVLEDGAAGSTQPEEKAIGEGWSRREVPASNRGWVRIGSAPPSPTVGVEGRAAGSSEGGPILHCDGRAIGVRLEETPMVQEIVPVAAQGVVRPVTSVLEPKKHVAVQVVGVGEGLNPKPIKNRILPSSIRGSAPRGSIKKGIGNTVNSKLGIKQTKRDDRGQVNPVVHSSLAELVADLDRAEAAVKDRGIEVSDGSGGSDVQHQWRVNSVFEQPGLSDMQGALDPVVARSFKLLCRSKMPDIVAIFEPRISGRAADGFIRKSGFEFSFRVEARGFSGGIWVLWKGSVKLRALEPEQGIPWVLGGDLNVIGNSCERRGGSERRSGVCPLFGEFLFETGLLDMGFHGPQFTWRRGNLFQRLDRCLCNKSWYDSFSMSEVFHLVKLGSDHRPILLDSGVRRENSGCKPFRYLAAWNEHVDFPSMLARSWSNELSIHENINQFQQMSSAWSLEVFGHIGNRKRHILDRLRGIERTLEMGPNLYLEELEKALKSELDIVLLQEESLWHQRARSDWIDKGDRNTKFFHLSAMIRKKRNSIKSLKIGNRWCVDQAHLREHAVVFFQQLFTSERQNGHWFTVPPAAVALAVEADKRNWRDGLEGVEAV
ncbi:hypothetical protein GQ457_04G008120 [Hibiscus cannabinus]